MIERLINVNLNFLKKYVSCDDDSIEIYRYSLRIIYSYFIDVLLLMSLAFLTHKVFETAIILLTFAVLQVYGGGYHANTKFRCLSIMVIGWFIGVFGLPRIVSSHWLIGIGVATIFTIFVFLFTPVLNPKHPVSVNVYKRSKKIVRVFCIAIDILILICIGGKFEMLYNAICVMMVLYSISLIAAENIKKQSFKNLFDINHQSYEIFKDGNL